MESERHTDMEGRTFKMAVCKGGNLVCNEFGISPEASAVLSAME